MRKRKQGRTLSRNYSQRLALKRTLLVSLLEFGSIKTTLAKAKELRPFAERLITVAKRDNVEREVIRRLKKDLPLKSAKKVLELARLYKDRQGGYLRIVKLMPRKTDFADMAIVSWVDADKVIDSTSLGKNKSNKKADFSEDDASDKNDKSVKNTQKEVVDESGSEVVKK